MTTISGSSAANDASRAMTGKTCLVTGGTAGIGYVVARGLAEKGAEVVIVGRDAERGASAAAMIRQSTGNDAIEYISADLSEQSGVRIVASILKRRRDRLDVLINNAGGLFGRRRVSPDGVEMTFALNHLNYFLLTHLLLPMLQAAAPARIVNVASQAHRDVTLDFDDLQGEERYDRWIAYKRSKLANIMFTYELARRIDGGGVTVNALHPGFVATDIGARHGFVPTLAWRIGCLFAISPERGGRTPLHLATDSRLEGVSGKYFIDCAPMQSSPQSYDTAAQARLWDVSLNLTGLSRRPTRP